MKLSDDALLAHAAKRCHAEHQAAVDAARLKVYDPEAFEAVKAGRMTLAAAKRKMREQIGTSTNLPGGGKRMRGMSPKTEELIAYAYRLLAENNPMTLRQLHYAIFSREEIPYENSAKDYRRLSRVTTIARRRDREWHLKGGSPEDSPWGGIPHGWIVDETRQATTGCAT